MGYEGTTAVRYESKLLIKFGFLRKLSDGHKYESFAKRLKTPSKEDWEKFVKKLKEQKKVSRIDIPYEEYIENYFEQEFKKIESEKGTEAYDIFEDLADHDYLETGKDQLTPTFHPTPLQHHYVIYESPKEGIEPLYFWSLNHLQHDLGFPVVHKITDVYAASEHSSFYAAGASRMGLAQDKIVTYIAQIGRMVKELFQMVRELRWIDENLAIYRLALDPKKPDAAADRTLKGKWTDLVDSVIGGQRTPQNIFLLAQQIGFQTLPNLFFNTTVQNIEGVQKAVEDKWGIRMNNDVKGMLISKLTQYLSWRQSTFDEIIVRRKFNIDYLAQHFNIIRMYMAWTKPYLKRMRNLSVDERRMDAASLISSFETNYTEIEILATMVPQVEKVTSNIMYACVLLTFEYQTRPSLPFSTEGGYHRGPIHAGHAKITWRSYAWDQKKIDAFMKMKAMEDLEMLKLVDRSLSDAMDALGKDLRNYLFEASVKWSDMDFKPEEEKETKEIAAQPNIFEPFVYLVRGPYDIARDLGKDLKSAWKAITGAKEEEKGEDKTAGDDKAPGLAKSMMFNHYKNFKKSHRMQAF